jgi:hypothetical protein
MRWVKQLLAAEELANYQAAEEVEKYQAAVSAGNQLYPTNFASLRGC